MKRSFIVDVDPDDPGETWKRSEAGCLSRLKDCEAGMEHEHGTGMNLGWLYWSGEWQTAFEWLQEHAPHAADRLVAEAEAKAAADDADGR